MPSASSTRKASPSGAVPAATTGMTGRPPCARRTARRTPRAAPAASRSQPQDLPPATERRPRRGDKTPIARVTTEDLDDQRPALRCAREYDRHPPWLVRGGPLIARRHPGLGESPRDLLERALPPGKPKTRRPSQPRRSRSGSRPACRPLAEAERDAGAGPETDDPSPRALEGLRQMRRGGGRDQRALAAARRTAGSAFAFAG